jgi:hypothetical protein
MPVKVTPGEMYLSIAYRFQFEDGTRFVVTSTPLSPEVAREIIGNVTEDYSLISPVIPPGKAWPFIRGFTPQVSYVTENTGLRGSIAELFSMLCPLLVALRPVDELIDAAEEWYRSL